MNSVKPTKRAEHAAAPHKVHVVTSSRLAAGHHNTPFPQGANGHMSPRQGHGGSHTVASKGRK